MGLLDIMAGWLAGRNEQTDSSGGSDASGSSAEKAPTSDTPLFEPVRLDDFLKEGRFTSPGVGQEPQVKEEKMSPLEKALRETLKKQAQETATEKAPDEEVANKVAENIKGSEDMKTELALLEEAARERQLFLQKHMDEKTGEVKLNDRQKEELKALDTKLEKARELAVDEAVNKVDMKMGTDKETVKAAVNQIELETIHAINPPDPKLKEEERKPEKDAQGKKVEPSAGEEKPQGFQFSADDLKKLQEYIDKHPTKPYLEGGIIPMTLGSLPTPALPHGKDGEQRQV